MLKAIVITGVLLSALTVAIFSVGELLSAPVRTAIGMPPPELGAETVSISDSQGRKIVGWFSRGNSGYGSILLLHAVRGNRRQMTGRATCLHSLGYSVLLIDLQAHGESDGDRITFGYRESDGVKAAINFLRTQNGSDRIGIIGVSLGAASFVLSEAKPSLHAVILESMYPTIEEAVANRLRLRLGSIGPLFTPVLISQLKWRLGVDATQLQPIKHIASIGAPVFIISGNIDGHTTAAETKRIFDAAQEPKQLWLVDGAAHVDIYAYAPQMYKQKISEFLKKYLGVHG